MSKKTKAEYEALLISDADAAIEAKNPLYLREEPKDPSKVPSGSWWWRRDFGNRNRKVTVTMERDRQGNPVMITSMED